MQISRNSFRFEVSSIQAYLIIGGANSNTIPIFASFKFKQRLVNAERIL